MLESCVNQAAGLQSLALQLSPRLMAVTSHGQQRGELPLLWGLCASWADMGLSVVVLDGHAQESPQNPGLTQMLDNALERFSDEAGSVSWSVIPAARGFQRLSATGFSSNTVGELFQNYSVVLIYANADTMTRLVKGSGLTPLLVVSPLKSSSLTAYRALKQLLLDAQLRPTVANITLVPNATVSMQRTLPAQHLQDCAETFLGYTVKPLTIVASARAESSRDDINRLALQLLENAVPLERHPITRIH
jgi:hypothetical protein